MKGETAPILRAWPAPIFTGLSPSPAWLCRLCVTEGESQAVVTRPAVSPRCVACTAFPLSQICPVWTKASWRPLCITPAVFSRPLSLPPCTRASSSRGAGTQTAHPNVLPLHHLSPSWGPFSSTVAEDQHLSHKLQRLSLSRKPNLISITNTREKFFQTARLRQMQTKAGQTSVRGSFRSALLCHKISAAQLQTEM